MDDGRDRLEADIDLFIVFVAAVTEGDIHPPTEMRPTYPLTAVLTCS